MTENLAKANALKYKTYPDRKLVFISAFESKFEVRLFCGLAPDTLARPISLSSLDLLSLSGTQASVGGTEIHPEFPIFSR